MKICEAREELRDFICPREDLEALEERDLVPYALKSSRARREFPEEPDPLLTAYQVDEKRIGYALAERGLSFKTQVFARDFSPHPVSRRLHSIYVMAQAWKVAAALRLNESATRAIAHGHDLGTPPFGHAGEDALNSATLEAKGLDPVDPKNKGGGFNANAYTLRVVQNLNLTTDVLEGLAKHVTPYDRPDPEFIARFGAGPPSLEAQIVRLVDRISFSCHDLQDGLNEEILSPDSPQFQAVPFLQAAWNKVLEQAQGKDVQQQTLYATLERVVRYQLIDNLIEYSATLIKKHRLSSPDEVKSFPHPLISLSPEMKKQTHLLEGFLSKNLYHSPLVEEMWDRARGVIISLFRKFVDNPQLLPKGWRPKERDEEVIQAVIDYIASLTDLKALGEYERIVGKPAKRYSVLYPASQPPST